MTALQQQTYRLLATVPPGRVTTYKALADALGTKAYRAIGQFMKKNPYAPDVPCHRVVASDGTIGGYNKGTAEKIRMLTAEGVLIDKEKIVNFSAVFLPLTR